MRVLRHAEDLVEGACAGAELGRVRLRIDQGALRLDRLDDDVGALGDEIGEDRRPLRGAHTRDVRKVLDRHGQAGEEPALGRGQARERRGALARTIQAQGRKRVHHAVHLADARFERVEKVVGRNLAFAEPRDEARRRLPDQFGTHISSALRFCPGPEDRHVPLRHPRATRKPRLATTELSLSLSPSAFMKPKAQRRRRAQRLCSRQHHRRILQQRRFMV